MKEKKKIECSKGLNDGGACTACCTDVCNFQSFEKREIVENQRFVRYNSN